MIVSAITAFTFTPNHLKPESKNPCKTNPLQQDTFQLQGKSQPNFEATYSIIPSRKIFKCLSDFSKQLEEISDINVLRESASNFFLKNLNESIQSNSKKVVKRNSFIHFGFIDDVVNKYSPIKARVCDFPPSDINLMKTQLKEAIKTIRFTAHKWKTFEKWLDHPCNNISVDEVMTLIKQMQRSTKNPKYMSLEGYDLIKEHMVKDPVLFYNLFSQTYIDTSKYCKSNNIKVKIERVSKNHRRDYYAYFTPSKAKPLPAGDPKEIFNTLAAILQENGRSGDIEKLIHKNKNDIWSLRVPLVGYNEPYSILGGNYKMFSSGQKFLS